MKEKKKVKGMKRVQFFRDKVKEFYSKNKRKFFWRTENLSPYQVLLIELFLKLTRAETVNTRLVNFIHEYDSNHKLLKEEKEVLFSRIKGAGLGNQRTRALERIAEFIEEKHNGRLPSNLNELMKIPYVGLYTANAVLCFGFNRRASILDVNASRIISRFFSIDNTRDLRDNEELQQKAKELLPRKNFKEYNWGLLDLGALVCKPRPSCEKCPLRRKCNYYSKQV